MAQDADGWMTERKWINEGDARAFNEMRFEALPQSSAYGVGSPYLLIWYGLHSQPDEGHDE